MNTTTETPVKKDNEVMNSILLRRRKKFIVSEVGQFSNLRPVKAINMNIASLGYVLSPELVNSLKTLDIDELTNINKFLVNNIKEMVGAGVKYRPLFRNFPEDVPDTFEYYLDRVIAHYESVLGLTENLKLLSCGCLIDTEKWDMSNFGACPICQMQIEESDLLSPKKRKKLSGRTKLKVIELGNEKEVIDIFKNLVSSKTSISEQDKEDIKSIFIENKHKVASLLPEQIFHKEILAFVSSLALAYTNDASFVLKHIKNVTDVLRLAVSMSNGDISLATFKIPFIKFSRKERRFLLSMIENCKVLKEDMKKYQGNWIRLGEILHPGEYKKRFPKTFEAFSTLRKGEKIETFNSKAEVFLKSKDVSKLAELLQSRPSEFGRKLDWMISNSTSKSEQSKIVGKFTSTVVHEIPTPVLLQIMSNFKIRASKSKDIRIIMPKGNLAKVKVMEDQRQTMSEEVSLYIVELIKSTLRMRFSKLPAIGNVYIDKKLHSYIIPSSQRSASKALNTITRGTQVQIPNGNTVRMFVYWHEPLGQRTDVDLSAIMFDENWEYKEHISYTNYQGNGCTHSGDIQSAPNGAAEFIDIDRKAVLKNGCRYIAMNIYGFTGQHFVDMPECFAGIMSRKDAKDGEIFDAKTVKEKFDVASESTCSIPLVLDLKTNRMIWCDLALKNGGRYINVESNKGNVKLMCQALSRFVEFKTNIQELLSLHAESRGKIVDTPEEADLVFSCETIPTQLESIMSEYLS